MMFICYPLCVFFFKQKTAYEMRISDWSSDVCSSDLETQPAYWINVAFKVPVSRLETLLWGALAKDLAPIQPQFNCALYLFNLPQEIGRASCRERVCQYV